MTAGPRAPSEDGALYAHDSKLVLDQLALALRNLGPNHWIMPIFTGIVCAIFRRWIGLADLALWFAGVCISVVPLTVASSLFWKRQPGSEDWRAWLLAISCGYGIFCTAWSSLGWFLWVPHDDLNHMIVLLLLACTIAGNSALISASKPLSRIAFLTNGVALVLTPLQEGGPIYNGLAVLAFLYLAYLFYMSKQIYTTAKDMLELRYDKNDLIAALASAKDESDRARERAEAASLAKSQFLANMSHELRTPLNAILGFSEIISSRVLRDDVSKHYEYAQLIHGSGQHLLTLINDILDLAKIEAGRLTLSETEVDLDHVIEDTSHLVAPKAREAGCHLAKTIPPGLPRLYADERAIKQIMLNLLSNAVKFTPPGGTVTAFARVEDDGRIAFGVSDTGVGIAKEDQALVFQKFGQGRHDVVTAEKGTGLGLPIVKGLVQAHGGTIALESEVGHGTTITVWMPAVRARPAVRRLAS